MLLSVIVPCYNVGPGIQDLLQSISAQMGTDCELVLINDGSTDKTSGYIREFIDAFSGVCHIVFKETANAGAAKARELGQHLAKGEFIYFCDSDDVFHEEFVSSFRRYLTQYPGMEMMFFSSDMAVDNSGVLQRVASKVAYSDIHVFEKGGELLAYNLKQGMYTAAVWTYVVRRTLIARSEALFTQRSAHEDHLFTLRTIINASLIIAVPDLLYTQKVRQGSLTNSRKNVEYLVDRITAYDEARAFLEKAGQSYDLYDAWSLGSILSILNDNPALWPSILVTPLGFSYFLKHLPALAGRFGHKIQRYISKRIKR